MNSMLFSTELNASEKLKEMAWKVADLILEDREKQLEFNLLLYLYFEKNRL